MSTSVIKDTSNSTSAESTNVAVQLIKFNREEGNDKSTIKLNDDLFKSLVTQAGERPVSVICICGPSRQGKSFMLGYIIRYLEALEKGNSDYMGWNNTSKPLKGFKFENGMNPVTQGIWVWNRPFIVKNDEGKEIAVLLVDTQGTNDEFTTTTDMSTIVGLSLLMSSVTIFNFFNNLQEDVLAALNMFVQYGLLALENVEGAPFQKLMFLIRDWNMPSSYPYGEKGGKKFIEDKLKVKPGQPPEVVQVREMIRKCFEYLDCFLLPHIGQNAITNENFTGSIGELEPLFAKKTEEFISSLISSETLGVKRVLGNLVTMSELKTFLDGYVQVFNSNDVPSASNMWAATSDAHLIFLVTKSHKKFVEFMKKRQRGSDYLSEDELESALSRAAKQAVELFEKEKKFGGKEKAEQHQQQLVQIVEESKTEIRNANEEKRKTFLAGAISDATTHFRSLLEIAAGLDAHDLFHFHEDSVIKKAAKQSMYTVIEDFKEKLTNESEESVKSKEQTLRSILASCVDTHMSKNALRRAAAEGEMQKIVELSVEIYHEQLRKFLKNQFSDFGEFADWLEPIKENGVKSFEDRKKPGDKSFQQLYRAQLEKKMEEVYSNLENSHKLRLQRFQAKVDKDIGEAADLCSLFLRGKMEILKTKKEVKQIYVLRAEEIMQNFKNKGNPYPKGHTMHLESCNKLQNKLEAIYKIALKEAAKAKKRIEDSYRAAVAKAFDHYASQMKQITESREFMVQEVLKVEHQRVVKEALEMYESTEKLGVPRNAQDFTQILVDDINKQFEGITEEGQRRHEYAKLLAQNIVIECLEKYEETMKESMIKSSSLEDLDKCHQTALTGAKQLFMQKCPGRNNPTFILEYEQQLEKKMEEAYSNLKNSHKLRLQEFQAKVDKVIGETADIYSKMLQEEMKILETDEEVEKIHVSELEKAMQSFKSEGNPYPKGNAMHLESCNKLQNKLEDIYKTALKEAAKAKKRIEDSYRAAVSKALDHYASEMTKITESFDFMVGEALQVEHERVATEALEMYEGIEKLGVPRNASEFTQILVKNIMKQFKRIREEGQRRHEHAKLLAQTTVTECLNKYEENMKKGMSKSRSLEELEKCHQTAVTGGKELFMQKCPGKNNSAFIQEYVQQLQNTIDGIFGELQEIFELKLEIEGAETKSLLVDCTAFYHDQMQKNVQNDMFVMPQILVEYHTAVVRSALHKFNEQQLLNENQKMDLEMGMRSLFIKYRIENDMKLNYRTKGEAPAIGIDLGTTYCCVGVYLNGQVVIIPNQYGPLRTPSFVAYEQDGSVTVGELAKEKAFVNPENTIFDTKRIIGRPMSDEKLKSDMKCWPFTVASEEGVPKIKLSDGKLLYPEEICAELLKECREIAEDYLNLPRNRIKKAVITVPAYFEDGQRQATVSAGRLAGLEVVILNEPTAAAIAYSQKRKDAGARKVLIFDMGRRTFDVAVLDMKAGKIEVLGVSGENNLGGEDFDSNMMKYCAQKFKDEHGIDLLAWQDSNRIAEENAKFVQRRLTQQCENAKKNLSTATTVKVSVFVITRNLDLNVNVTREVFQEINEKYFSKSIDIVEEALKKVGVSKESIDDIVLVGGSTRIPRIQELLTEYFCGKVLSRSIHPDHVVAYGAAIKAAMLNGEQIRGRLGLDSLTIQDVTPFSLGIETSNKKLFVIIPMNSKIPTTRNRTWVTMSDNQTSAEFKIYLGEDLEIAANNKLLGKLVLDNIPPAPREREPVDVIMEINEMGILEVTAVIRSTKGSNKITIQGISYGMCNYEVDGILGEANPAA